MAIKWKEARAPLWERAPFFRLLLPLVAGIVVYDRLYPGHGSQDLFTAQAELLVCIGLTGLAAWRTGRTAILRSCGFAAVFLCITLTGTLISYLGDMRNNADWFGRQRAPYFLVRVASEPQLRDSIWRMPVYVEAGITDGRTTVARGDAILYVRRDSLPLHADTGDTLMVPGRWSPVRNKGNPHEFDYAAFCRRNNVFFTQNCRVADIRIYGKATTKGRRFVEVTHDWAADRLHSMLKDSLSANLVDAMVLGDESVLDPELTRSWAAAGIVHVIAISGGNVIVFFWLISGLFFWIRNRKYRWLKFLLAVPPVWLYVLIAGGSPSAIRAAVMFTFLAGVLVFRQRHNPINQLFGSAFLMLLCEPQWLFSIGFQLSYVAVLSLIIFYDRIYCIFRPRQKLVRLIWETVVASVAAEILVAPLVVFYYHNFPVWFLVSNVVAWAFMGFVQIAGMGLVFLGQIPNVGSALATLTEWLIRKFNHFIGQLNHLNPEFMQRLSLSVCELCVVYFVIAGIGYYQMRKKRSGLLVALVSLNVLAALCCWNEWRELNQNFVVVYHVRRGAYVERIVGQRCDVLIPDSVDIREVAYVSHPPHLAWQLEEPLLPSGCDKDVTLTIGGRTLLVCREPGKYHTRFPVDYVFVTGKKADPVHIDSVFSPVSIVLKNWRQLAGKPQKIRARDLRARMYVLRNKGAFLLGRTSD